MNIIIYAISLQFNVSCHLKLRMLHVSFVRGFKGIVSMLFGHSSTPKIYQINPSKPLYLNPLFDYLSLAQKELL